MASALKESRELALISKARQQLEAARSVDEVLEIRDKAEALRRYFQTAERSLEAQNAACEIKLRAERKAGDMLAPVVRRGNPQLCPEGTIRLDDMGISRKQSAAWQKIASLEESVFEEFIEDTKSGGGELTSKAAAKLAKKSTNRTKQPDPKSYGLVASLGELIAKGAKFPTIYADPPWEYSNKGTRSAVEGEYKSTMTVDAICAEPVAELAADQAHLHLWTTNAFLPEAFRVIAAWGFEYKSCLVWVKPQLGIGNYWRVSHEFMLLGVRGKLGFEDHAQKSWLVADRTKHSRKPREVRDAIEKVSLPPYLEMYGREPMPHPWTVYGNEVESNLFHEAE
jgi:N6-adenosine-specific RNA methylase IME4